MGNMSDNFNADLQNTVVPPSQQGLLNERNKAVNRYNSSVANLLLVVIFSVVNCLLLIFNSNTYFLFTASIPYIIIDLGMYICGKYPADAYVGIEDTEFLNDGVFIFLASVALVIILLYFVCWLFARKGKVGWLIASLVFFGIDTAAMFYWYVPSVDMIMDYVFHGWVLISLILGITAYFKLKKFPVPQPSKSAADMTEFAEQTDTEVTEEQNENSGN